MEYVDILEVYPVYTRDACIVTITALIDKEVCIFTGTSRRHPQDKPNEKLAHMIAYARAYEAMSCRLIKRARGYMKHVDDVRVMSENQKKTNEHRTNLINKLDASFKARTENLSNFSFVVDHDIDHKVKSHKFSFRRKKQTDKD